MIKYQAKIWKDGKRYSVIFPDLAGCFSDGKTIDEALENAKESLSLYLEEARDPKWKLPVPKSRSSKNYYWITPFPDVAIPLMIRKARIDHGLTQKEFAKKLGITFQQVQKLETPGKSNPTVKTLSAISRVLGRELDIELAA